LRLQAVACLLTLGICFLAAAQDEPVAKFGTTVVIPSGFRGLVYHIRRGSIQLPDFRKLKPSGTIYTAALNVPPQSFRDGFPGVTKRFEWFAIDYAARFWIERPGAYQFALVSDDGSRLYIDDRQIVDNDGIHSAQRRAGSVDLSRGIHQMHVSYFQGPRDEVALILQVAGAGERFRIFSTDEFKPPANPENWTLSEPIKK
jgi:PA14 domain